MDLNSTVLVDRNLSCSDDDAKLHIFNFFKDYHNSSICDVKDYFEMNEFFYTSPGLREIDIGEDIVMQAYVMLADMFLREWKDITVRQFLGAIVHFGEKHLGVQNA